MNLKEFKKQVKQLEDKLLTDYNLSDKEVEIDIAILGDYGYTYATIEELYYEETDKQLTIKGNT